MSLTTGSQSSATTATSSTSWETSSSSTSSISTLISTFTSSSSLPFTSPSSSTTPTTRTSTITQSCTKSSSTSLATTLPRTTTSQSSVSQTSGTTSATLDVTTTASSSISSSTLTPIFSTRQHGTFIQADSTSLVTVSAYETPFTSQAPSTQTFQSITPTTTTSGSEPTSTSVSETPGRATHRLIIDLGDCAEFTSPSILLERGDLGDLVAIGKGRFAIELRTELSTGIFGLVLSLKDDGVRCGNDDSAACTAVELSFDLTSGVSAHVLRAGDYGVNMYPFNVWLEDGVTWGAQLANSPEEAYHCWGWSEEECPYAFADSGDASWTLSSENPTGLVYVGFCPSDGPDWSKIPPNPDPPPIHPDSEGTFIILPTQTVLSTSTFLTVITPTQLSVPITSAEPTCDVPLSCIFPNTYISEDMISTIVSQFITLPTDMPTGLFSTAIVLHTTSTVPKTTFLNIPTSTPTTTTTSWIVKSTDGGSEFAQSEGTLSTSTRRGSRRPTATATATATTTRTGTGTALSESDIPISTSSPTVVPSFSDITNSLGSVISTLSYNATVSPVPTTTSAPDSQYLVTSWTTWMTVNGSTVPAIAGEVSILSTIPITYMLEPSTTIPVAELSSRSVESVRTSSPSPTTAASSENNQTGENKGGKIAGAVVGTLVGLVLGSLLLWYICYRHRQRRRLDHFARGDPAWLAPRHENGSGGGSRLLVDLDEEPRMRNSYVEPWVPPRPVAQTSPRIKTSQPEMESAPGAYGVSTMAGPSREIEASSNEGGSSWFQSESSDMHHVPAAVATRVGKSTTRNEPTRRPDMLSQRPVPSHYRAPSLANPSLSLLPTPFQNEPPSPLTPPSPPSRAALMPDRASSPPRAGPSQRRYPDEEEQIRHNAIPPLYNEAWNTGR
ncbi:hypothetical protein RSOLAG22IIIB_04566 [Rhizoctonia solani]|uniref:Uncharacterized protein n=1 Tax=Rhizoctonia solani TaxID=456999 RepID=A0A0K6FZ33_9AGAM|nr:hypothetical protein RSOLAG22IIIB_04566 [Rhizoctonia solani]